jgi:hypothetical protein
MTHRRGVGRERGTHKLKFKKGKSGSSRARGTSPIPAGDNVYFGYSGQLLVGGYVATVQQAKYAYSHHLVKKPKAVHGGSRSHKAKSAQKPRSTGHTATHSSHHTTGHPMMIVTTPPSLGATTRRKAPPPDALPLSGAVF